MNTKISVFVICVKVIIYLLLHNLHDCTFNNDNISNQLVKNKNDRSLSGSIRVRIPQKLDVVAFWPWNLDVVVFQFWNLDVVAFHPLKKCLGITMSWLNCLRFSSSWCFRPRILMSRFFGLGISMLSWFFGLGISMSWFSGLGISMSRYMCLHGLVFVFIVKTEKRRKIF